MGKLAQFPLDATGNPNLAELCVEEIQTPDNREVRDWRGITHYEHRRCLAPTPLRRNVGRCRADSATRRMACGSFPRVRRPSRARAPLGHRAQWRARFAAVAGSPPPEFEGPQ